LPLFRLFRLQKMIDRFGLFRRVDRENLAIIFAQNLESFAKPELKLKVYEIVLRLRREMHKRFGLLIVLGWKREWNDRHTSLPDATQDIFVKHHIDIANCPLKQAAGAIKKTADFDGAILVSRDGKIFDSGVFLENLHPKAVAKILHPSKAEDLSSAFGFVKKVHIRHLAAIAASYALKGTTVFVLSEEDNTIRVMEKGRIIWSTVREEVGQIVESVK